MGHGCMGHTERAEMAAVSCGIKNCTKKKKLFTHVKSHASAVSLPESGEQQYISDQQPHLNLRAWSTYEDKDMLILSYTQTHTANTYITDDGLAEWDRRKKMTEQYAEQKRWVFSFDLKEDSEDECLTLLQREHCLRVTNLDRSLSFGHRSQKKYMFCIFVTDLFFILQCLSF